MSETKRRLLTLQDLGYKHKTDKCDINHTFADNSYLQTYEGYLNHLREKEINFLEIGVRDGCSHRMWSDFFSKESRILGLDIDPRCKQFEEGNIEIFIGSQSDPDTINKMLEAVHDGFDVILDDGSHINELTLESFDLLFPHLKPGGMYIIEDLACSYLGKQLWNDIIVGAWPGMQYNQNVKFINKREDMDKFFLGLIKQIDLSQTHEYEWVHFYSKIAIIKKQAI